MAIAAEQERKDASWSPFWQYSGLSLYARAVENYATRFPGAVFVYRFEDYVGAPTPILSKLCAFLDNGVPDVFPVVERVNPSGEARHPRIARLVAPDRMCIRAAARVVPKRWHARIRLALDRPLYRADRSTDGIPRETLHSFEADQRELQSVMARHDLRFA